MWKTHKASNKMLYLWRSFFLKGFRSGWALVHWTMGLLRQTRVQQPQPHWPGKLLMSNNTKKHGPLQLRKLRISQYSKTCQQVATPKYILNIDISLTHTQTHVYTYPYVERKSREIQATVAIAILLFYVQHAATCSSNLLQVKLTISWFRDSIPHFVC